MPLNHQTAVSKSEFSWCPGWLLGEVEETASSCCSIAKSKSFTSPECSKRLKYDLAKSLRNQNWWELSIGMEATAWSCSLIAKSMSFTSLECSKRAIYEPAKLFTKLGAKGSWVEWKKLPLAAVWWRNQCPSSPQNNQSVSNMISPSWKGILLF